jgi:hypothetical protein
LNAIEDCQNDLFRFGHILTGTLAISDLARIYFTSPFALRKRKPMF